MVKILIIEDEKPLLENLQMLVKEFGYDVHIAANGLEGIRAAKEVLPDLIICDIMMPEVDGYEVFKELSQHNETESIPFIFLTAKSEVNDIRQGLSLGADDYVLKPYKAAELINTIRLRLSKKNKIINDTRLHLAPVSNQVQKTFPDYIFIKQDKSTEIIKPDDIVFIRSDDQYCKVNLSSGKVLFTRKLLKEFETLLPINYFIRISRSIIINIGFIEKIEDWFNQSYRIKLSFNNIEFISSRRYSQKLKEFFF